MIPPSEAHEQGPVDVARRALYEYQDTWRNGGNAGELADALNELLGAHEYILAERDALSVEVERLRASLASEHGSHACHDAVARATEEILCDALGIDPDGDEASMLVVQQMADRVRARLRESEERAAKARETAINEAVKVCEAERETWGRVFSRPLFDGIASSIRALLSTPEDTRAETGGS